ncbi:hypothetical protein ColLi_03679 [Colletotrichum liriopes]|uniref:Uncharacterized protein n=1 Tax=Colletotrichum liriopes TaxID=708192 RepID=A0AA37GI75_9PEZI|nr:hypothetical protein ColLi_03679 [Colletotrichum liriopes]
MATAGEQPEPPVLERDGFRLSQDMRFTVNGIDRMGGQKMAELFHPENFRSKRDRERTMDEAYALFSKPWFSAQLTHYGIKFSAKAAKGRLWDLLEKSVDLGKCNSVPEPVLRMQQSMRRDYKIMLRKWEADVRVWDAAEKRRDDEAFAECTTPGQKANCDMKRFLHHYFLTDGKPDPTRTPKPLVLHGFTKQSVLQVLVEHVPGLHTIKAGPQRTLCIGWDAPSLMSLAFQMDGHAVQVKNNPQDTVWEEAMESHRRYVSQQTKGTTKNGKPAKAARQSFDLERCQGSYVLKCKAVGDFDVDQNTLLTLDISAGKDGTLVAAHDFGFLEGTMILALAEEKLSFLDEIDGKQDSEGEEDSYDYGSSDCDPEDDRRKKGPSLAQVVASEKRKAKSTNGSAPAKKKRLIPSFSRRVYYRMRGRETGEGTCWNTTEAGHLDFLSDLGTEFVGLAYTFPYIGRNVEFRGYKIFDVPQKKPQRWSSLVD